MKNRLIKYISLLLLSLCAVSLAACKSDETPQHRGEIFALDTLITITAYGEYGAEGVSAGKQEIRRLEKLLSVTDKNSDISRINTSEGRVLEVSDETYSLIEKAIEVSTTTEGRFEPTIFPVVELWGFTEKDFSVPDDSEIKKALENVDYENITLLGDNKVKVSQGTKLDLGGIAKGYIADMTAIKMAQVGVKSGVISLGGNVKTFGENPNGDYWSVGVNHPYDGTAFCKVMIKDTSLVTSGAYQRNFTFNGTTYHHIIDASNGYPAESDIESVTVYCEDGGLADGLSTALYIGGAEYAAKLRNFHNNFEYIILTKNNDLLVSPALKDKIQLLEGYENLKITYK